MLFGGNSGSCGGCGCKSCQECTRTCTEPHTGTAFETVYTLYFEGAEAGNPTDGYLDATGDSDTSDPYDGMDGDGPWSQTVSGTFTLTKATTRYPCYFVASFWRSNFVLGANTTPPPSAALTSQTITVTNLGPGVLVHGEYEYIKELQPGESYTYNAGIPLVAGAGDQSNNYPRIASGRIAWRQKCVNETVSFTVSAEISWSVKKRQHVLYGLVLECYQEPGSDPCSTFCDGSPAPDSLYLTISGLSHATLTDISVFNGTYVVDAVDRSRGICNMYTGTFSTGTCLGAPNVFGPVDAGYGRANVNIGSYLNVLGRTLSDPSIYANRIMNGLCYLVVLECGVGLDANVCNTTSGTGTARVFMYLLSNGQAADYTMSFSWSLSS